MMHSTIYVVRMSYFSFLGSKPVLKSLCFHHRICSLAITAWMADKKFNVKFLLEFDGSAYMGDCVEKAVGVKPLWSEACFPLSQEEN